MHPMLSATLGAAVGFGAAYVVMARPAENRVKDVEKKLRQARQANASLRAAAQAGGGHESLTDKATQVAGDVSGAAGALGKIGLPLLI